MRELRKLRPSPAMIVAMIALFAALGGTVYAAGKLSGKSIKKNSEPGNRIKKASLPGNRVKKDNLTGAQINESTLGQVPSAANATNADNVTFLKQFKGTAAENTAVTLLDTADFSLIGWCNSADDQHPPGSQGSVDGSGLYIVDKNTSHAFADSDDESDYDFNAGELIGFNFTDFGDGGHAVAHDGHFIFVPESANTVIDTTDINEPTPGSNQSFAPPCYFQGLAYVG